jgi:hypothetical protein
VVVTKKLKLALVCLLWISGAATLEAKGALVRRLLGFPPSSNTSSSVLATPRNWRPPRSARMARLLPVRPRAETVHVQPALLPQAPRVVEARSCQLVRSNFTLPAAVLRAISSPARAPPAA